VPKNIFFATVFLLRDRRNTGVLKNNFIKKVDGFFLFATGIQKNNPWNFKKCLPFLSFYLTK